MHNATSPQAPPCILTVAQTRACEQYTMEHEPIPSLQLMERAGVKCAEAIVELMQHKPFSDIRIFCGTGNNGGDGLVIARILSEKLSDTRPRIEVVICQGDNARHTPEMDANLNRWQEITSQHSHATLTIFDPKGTDTPPADALIIDAIFGIGLSRPIEGICAEAIKVINDSKAMVIAIDTPSGLWSDMHTPADSAVVMADLTLSIQYPKMAYFLPEAYPFCGEVQLMDIGMYPPPDLDWQREFLTTASVAEILRPLQPYAHKGTFGHGLLLAGCAAMPGAAILAATAALRGGAGKVTVHTAPLAARHLPARLPEAILHIDANDSHISELDWSTLQKDINAIAIGPGIGMHRQTVNVLKNLLDEIHAPVILDADALNILSENKTWLAYLPPYSILTPHWKEFERLAGPSSDDFDRLEKAQQFAQRYDIILILKGRHTVISLPDGKQFVNTTGNAGMATAGSGDVLTGLLLSLMAQGYSPVESALIGVFVHGLAGDLYAREHSPRTLIASDLPQHFSAAYQKLNISDPKDSD